MQSQGQLDAPCSLLPTDSAASWVWLVRPQGVKVSPVTARQRHLPGSHYGTQLKHHCMGYLQWWPDSVAHRVTAPSRCTASAATPAAAAITSQSAPLPWGYLQWWPDSAPTGSCSFPLYCVGSDTCPAAANDFVSTPASFPSHPHHRAGTSCMSGGAQWAAAAVAPAPSLGQAHTGQLPPGMYRASTAAGAQPRSRLAHACMQLLR